MSSISLLEYNRLKNENSQLKQIIGVLTFEIEKSKKRREIFDLIQSRVKNIGNSLLSSLLKLSRSATYITNKKRFIKMNS